jgi:transcriptional repressor NrdR
VLDSRSIRDGEAIRRRRECLQCGRRFTTHEEIEETLLRVIKKDGRREPFDRAKIMRGLTLACHKRPISVDTLERVVDEIERRVHDRGEREVPATVVGEMVVDALRGLDPVAYVRFASVYREFQDATQFREIVDVMREESPMGDEPPEDESVESSGEEQAGSARQ